MEDPKKVIQRGRFVEALRKLFEANLRGHLSNLAAFMDDLLAGIWGVVPEICLMFAVDSLMSNTTYQFGVVSYACMFEHSFKKW